MKRAITGRKPKLTTTEVTMLRSLRRGGVDTKTLAARFGVDRTVIYDYLRGEHKNPAIVAVTPYAL